MPRWIIAASLCLSAGTAGASSIEPFEPTDSTRSSIVEVGCPACVVEAERKAAAEAEVKLAPGEQIIEVREIDGEQMIYRTEGWLGGSPVTMVRKAHEADLIALGLASPEDSQTAAVDGVPADTAPSPADQSGAEPALFEPVVANSSPGIDTEATTSALEATPKDEFDPSKFELRLN